MPQEDPSRRPTDPPTVRRPVYRTPNLRAFLGTGAVLGLIVGVLLDVLGPGCSPGVPGVSGDALASCGYEASSSLAYFAVLGIFVGMGVGAILAALVAGGVRKR